MKTDHSQTARGLEYIQSLVEAHKNGDLTLNKIEWDVANSSIDLYITPAQSIPCLTINFLAQKSNTSFEEICGLI